MVTRTSTGISGNSGEIDVASLVVDGVKRTEPPERLRPPLIALKDQIWHGISNAVPNKFPVPLGRPPLNSARRRFGRTDIP